MSQVYATIAADVLRADTAISAWATGGVLDRDPRRSGPNATGPVFDTDGNGDIRPTIAVTSGNATRTLGGPASAYDGTIIVRLFAPDYMTYYTSLDTIATRIIALLFGYTHDSEHPAQFRWNSRLGMQGGGAFEDVVYDEVRFRLIGLHEGVPT
jgi:hypothetical protein